jgi:peptidoglycan/LPS O-acetylase OafA/YrhL
MESRAHPGGRCDPLPDVDTRATRFPLFDSLRAIAALSVLLFHGMYGAVALSDPGSWVARFAAHLNVGVYIFFVISGFLLYRPFAAARLAGRPAPHAGAYAWRRFLRIVPAYWVALTAVVVVLNVPDVFTATGIPLFYGFAQVYSPSHALSGIGQAWSLDVELTFYLLLPVWAAALARLAAPGRRGVRTELVALAGLAAAGLAFQAWALGRGYPFAPGQQWRFLVLPDFLDCFALGMALAVVSAAWEGTPPFLRPLERFPSLAWLAAGALFWVLAVWSWPDTDSHSRVSDVQYFAASRLYALIALCLVLPAVFGDRDRGWVRALLRNRVLLYLGLVSYGIFLYHLAVFVQFLDWHGHLPTERPALVLWVAAGLAASVALASASYYLVERPALRLRRLVEPPGLPPDQPGAVSVPATPPAL